nr:ArsR family transcriptional regulator [Ruegeria atlantica]
MSILHWLKTPDVNFADQASGSPVEIGVCVTLITAKLGMSQPTVSRHLELLRRANFLTIRRIGKWSYYKRNEQALTEYRSWLGDTL